MKRLFRRGKKRVGRTASSSKWGTPNTTAVSIPSDLEARNVSFRVGDIDVLNDVSLFMKSGSVTCLLGPSGSGKTTLLRILAGMESQTDGSVLLDGREVSSSSLLLSPEKRGIGLIFQDYALFPHLTVQQNVAFGLAHLPRAAQQNFVGRILARVGLDDRMDTYPSMLSGGEQQRVALARALAPRPGVLLMDEPFSGLDSRLRDTMRDETLGILRETHATSVLVTHDPEEALRMGDLICLLQNGCVEQIGTGRELYYSPANRFVAGFFSELNTVPIVVRNGVADTPFGNIDAPNAPDGAASMCIRTSCLDITAPGARASASGKVLARHFAGHHEFLRIGVSGIEAPLLARVPSRGGGSLRPDEDTVHVRPRAEGTFIFNETIGASA